MRISNDIYKTKEGNLISINQMQEPPQNSTLWQGYDYSKQCWMFEGKKDTRTLEELKNQLKIAQPKPKEIKK